MDVNEMAGHKIVLAVFIALIGFSMLLEPSALQTPSKLSVYVLLSGEDTVGRDLAYSVREELRRSEAYSVGTANSYFFQIDLISLDLALPNESKGNFSAISVTFTMTNFLLLDPKNPQTWLPIYLTSSLFIVGRNRIDVQAKSVVASFDQAVERYKAQVLK